jgi:hypothetical protein
MTGEALTILDHPLLSIEDWLAHEKLLIYRERVCVIQRKFLHMTAILGAKRTHSKEINSHVISAGSKVLAVLLA